MQELGLSACWEVCVAHLLHCTRRPGRGPLPPPPPPTPRARRGPACAGSTPGRQWGPRPPWGPCTLSRLLLGGVEPCPAMGTARQAALFLPLLPGCCAHHCRFAGLCPVPQALGSLCPPNAAGAVGLAQVCLTPTAPLGQCLPIKIGCEPPG